MQDLNDLIDRICAARETLARLESAVMRLEVGSVVCLDDGSQWSFSASVRREMRDELLAEAVGIRANLTALVKLFGEVFQ